MDGFLRPDISELITERGCSLFSIPLYLFYVQAPVWESERKGNNLNKVGGASSLLILFV